MNCQECLLILSVGSSFRFNVCRKLAYGIRPKVWGTWNLHNALSTRESSLDFFLMTSSVSGTAATATESNYCAANAFQNAFARYRRSLGLKATALGIGMVSEAGYLHEHPEIEGLLLRKGLRPLTEGELLRIIDLALTNQNKTELQYGENHYTEGHILTGLESQGLQQLWNQGFEMDNHMLYDLRCGILANALSGATANPAGDSGDSHGSMPRPIADALAARDHQDGARLLEALSDAVREMLGHKIRHLLLLQPGQLGPQTRLGDFGMDSMLAADFRTFLFHALNIDVPFQTLLENDTTVAQLTQMVVERLWVGEEETVKIED